MAQLLPAICRAVILAVLTAIGLALWPGYRNDCRGFNRRAWIFFWQITLPGVVFALSVFWVFGAL